MRSPTILIVEDEAVVRNVMVTVLVREAMTGPQLAEKICQARPSLRVLRISGYLLKKLEEGEAKAGADFLEKPFSPKALIEKVRESLKRPKAQGSA
jgi:two-component system, cell cycle sensor histidine kinase and response regulator CckA